MTAFAEVVVTLPVEGRFHYAVPDHLRGALEIGHRFVDLPATEVRSTHPDVGRRHAGRVIGFAGDVHRFPSALEGSFQ